ncbi:hypothetical protein SDC9_209830 [bioreactor metagenome]|uniref:Uncharacterized protein n=1 Tax=bioreactor metagenome TaxID=1076179 RepID=A0A645JP58_9ZZZZ
MHIGDMGGIVFISGIPGDRIHRAGTVEGIYSDDIFNVLRPDALQHAFHPAAFQLENPFGLPV